MRTEHTRRGDHRNAVFIERFYQIFDKIGALADHRFVERLTQANGHRLDLADRDTAVSKETFVKRNQCLHLGVKIPAVRADAAAARRTELAGREIDQIGQTGHHLDDVGHRILFPLLLTLLNQVGVFTQQTGVEHEHNTVFVGHAAHVHQVADRERLPADQVRRGLHADKRNVLHAVLLDAGFELRDIHIAFERVFGMEDQRLVVKQFGHLTAVFENVRQCGGKVVVHRDHVARFDKSAADHVLGRTALVHRKQVFLAQHLLDCLLQALETLRTGIGVVGTQHRGDLVIAHRIGTAVGKHVEVDIFRTEAERIEAGILDRLQTAFDRHEI